MILSEAPGKRRDLWPLWVRLRRLEASERSALGLLASPAADLHVPVLGQLAPAQPPRGDALEPSLEEVGLDAPLRRWTPPGAAAGTPAAAPGPCGARRRSQPRTRRPSGGRLREGRLGNGTPPGILLRVRPIEEQARRGDQRDDP